jgi:hypothetical protein
VPNPIGNGNMVPPLGGDLNAVIAALRARVPQFAGLSDAEIIRRAGYVLVPVPQSPPVPPRPPRRPIDLDRWLRRRPYPFDYEPNPEYDPSGTGGHPGTWGGPIFGGGY